MATKGREALMVEGKVEAIARTLRAGSLARGRELIPLLSDDDPNVREGAQKLFAKICTHDDLRHFGDALLCAQDSAEVLRLIVAMGDTLSLNAIPLLMTAVEELESPDMNGYVALALKNILPIDGLDEYTIEDDEFVKRYIDYFHGILPEPYYYRGNPVFMGDLTKELVTAAQVSLREKSPIIVVRQAQLLSSFSGLQCPVRYGVVVGEQELSKVYDYVRQIADMGLDRGKKYYFQHQVY